MSRKQLNLFLAVIFINAFMYEFLYPHLGMVKFFIVSVIIAAAANLVYSAFSGKKKSP